MVNVIAAIEEKLQAQKDEIFFKDVQINDLKKKLEAAEAEKKDLESIIAEYVERGAAE